MYPDSDLSRTRLMLYRLRTLNKHVKLTKQWWTTVNTTSERKSETTGGTSQFFVLL